MPGVGSSRITESGVMTCFKETDWKAVLTKGDNLRLWIEGSSTFISKCQLHDKEVIHSLDILELEG